MITEHYPWHTGLPELCEVFQQHFRCPEINQAAEWNFKSQEVTFSVPKVVCTITIDQWYVEGKCFTA
eukprot:6747838-Heterocapsa_arctica.AAC.1